MKAAAATVLTCDGLSTSLDPEAGSFALTVRPGECVVFAGVEADSVHHLGDLFLGLQAPARGRVTFGGQDWQTMDPREAEHGRRQIGRVVATPGRAAWLQNLDVEENVYLARQFEPGVSTAGLRQRAQTFCHLFGLEALPTTRPAATSSDLLMRAQWVRAFLPEPLRLLVLEAPDWGARKESSGRLREQVRRARGAGTAVIWIDLGAAAGLDETLRYDGVPQAVGRRL
jgi:ABC-type uncharacterized transport system ATPase subunit